jgi:hypothetical protein
MVVVTVHLRTYVFIYASRCALLITVQQLTYIAHF